VVPRPFPGHAVDAARFAVNDASDGAAGCVQAGQRAFDQIGVVPIPATADEDSQADGSTSIILTPARRGLG
jgi:hypothetical protein